MQDIFLLNQQPERHNQIPSYYYHLQAEAIRRALESVRAAHEALTAGLTPDVVLTEAEGALDALGELTGRTAREDMVTRIFERFCVGK